MPERLKDIVEDALVDRWLGLPVLATYAGVRGYDHTIGDFSPEAVAERLRVKKALLARLARLRFRNGSPGAWDKRLLEGHLRVQVAEIEGWGRIHKDPSLYSLNAIRSLHLLLLRDHPARYRREMVRARLAEVPRVLRQGVENLRYPDRTLTEVAIAAAEAGVGFLRGAIRPFDPVRTEAAVRAMRRYALHLRKSVLPKARRTFPLGRRIFDLKLRLEHGLPYDADELYEIGREEIARTKAEMARLARRLDPNAAWQEVVLRLKRDHPSAGDVVAHHRRESRRLRAFCLREGLVRFPKGESLRVLPTPRFEWGTVPYAAMIPPGAFEKGRRSTFWVTPVDGKSSKRKQAERLREHCVWVIPLVALHEGYPGHHIQLSRGNRVRSKAGRVFYTPAMYEGWAHYCEQMMEETGYLNDDRMRLMRLKDQLWRACRVVADVGLHVRGWPHRRAADLLVREALLERPNAAAEVNRYCGTPTEPLSYTMGKLEILKLRSAARVRWGRRYSLRRFHDWLLDHGSAPPSWLQP
ncbi:MAG: DUF885 domain-containing protein [Elusimicrobiota bacterium]